MKLYWVSLLIQDAENSKPWLSAMSSGCTSLEEAMKMIKRAKVTIEYYVHGLIHLMKEEINQRYSMSVMSMR